MATEKTRTKKREPRIEWKKKRKKEKKTAKNCKLKYWLNLRARIPTAYSYQRNHFFSSSFAAHSFHFFFRCVVVLFGYSAMDLIHGVRAALHIFGPLTGPLIFFCVCALLLVAVIVIDWTGRIVLGTREPAMQLCNCYWLLCEALPELAIGFQVPINCGILINIMNSRPLWMFDKAFNQCRTHSSSWLFCRLTEWKKGNRLAVLSALVGHIAINHRVIIESGRRNNSNEYRTEKHVELLDGGLMNPFPPSWVHRGPIGSRQWNIRWIYLWPDLLCIRNAKMCEKPWDKPRNGILSFQLS